MITPDHQVAVIGAGPGGIAAGVKLKHAGIEDFAILERGDEVGGSWRENDYPGIAVDIPSVAYQYSFARNAEWSRVFAHGAEVQAYHVEVSHRFGLRPHLLFGTDVTRQVWDESSHVWELHIADGRIVTARFLITAVGAFINPIHDPGIPGLGDFAGKIQRPTDWDHGYELVGKRVAVIGTGASSVQITPAIAPRVASLEVFQRTPVWCLPKPDFEMPAAVRKALRVPGVAAALNGAGLVGVDAALRMITAAPPWAANPVMGMIDSGARRAYRSYLRRRVEDEDTRRALEPNYGPFGKRPTMSNGFIKAFNRENTALVTTPIDRFTAGGVQTTDGREHLVDMVVLATGYELFSDPESYREGQVAGRDGFDLGRFFAENRLQAYESVALPQLPNRWMLVGPYSWTGTGWHALVEVSAQHAARAIGEARRRQVTSVEVRQEAHDAYHQMVRRRGRNIAHYFTEQNKGLRTYYVNSQGDMPYIRPGSAFDARWRSTHFPLEDYRYEVLPKVARAGVTGPRGSRRTSAARTAS